jgi:anti-sigma factor RsiW
MTQPNFRDVELLSAYLDGQLSQAESARLEARLKTDPQLRTVFDDLSQSRALLRKLPARRAPRNFTLTPRMAGIKPPIPRAFPVFRLASALAAILFFFSFAVNLTVPVFSGMHAAAPMPAYGIGGGGGADPALEAAQPVATEAPAAAAAPAAPAATAAPAMMVPAAPPAPAATMSAQDAAALTPTPESMRTMASSETETPSPTEMAPTGPAQSKMSPTEPPAPMEFATPLPPQEVQPPIPAIVVVGLFILAVLAGVAALFVRWRADSKFAQIIKKK